MVYVFTDLGSRLVVVCVAGVMPFCQWCGVALGFWALIWCSTLSGVSILWVVVYRWVL